eukprot:COSAG05_NODE_1697_length_4258_cov_7.337822_9_plen_89_part_00
MHGLILRHVLGSSSANVSGYGNRRKRRPPAEAAEGVLQIGAVLGGDDPHMVLLVHPDDEVTLVIGEEPARVLQYNSRELFHVDAPRLC